MKESECIMYVYEIVKSQSQFPVKTYKCVNFKFYQSRGGGSWTEYLPDIGKNPSLVSSVIKNKNNNDNKNIYVGINLTQSTLFI